MYFIIENNGEPLRWESDNEIVRYGSFKDALIDFHPQDGDFIVAVAKDREEALKWIDKHHGIEYDAGEGLYLLDGWSAEWYEDGKIWSLYADDESEIPNEVIRVEG